MRIRRETERIDLEICYNICLRSKSLALISGQKSVSHFFAVCALNCGGRSECNFDKKATTLQFHHRGALEPLSSKRIEVLRLFMLIVTLPDELKLARLKA